jgi:HAD superfamily hydrolase (TIGR01509 family)
MLEALIFDVDGTIADTEEAHRQAFNEAFRAYGLAWQWSAPLYAELLRTTGGKERIAAYLQGLPLPEERKLALGRLIPEIHGTKTRLYNELVGQGRVRPRPGVRRLLTEARQAGVRLAIASTTSPQNVHSLLSSCFGPEVPRWFAPIVTGDVVANKKPSPEVYLLALAELRIPSSRAVAVEDSAIGVRSAKAAGLFTVVTPSPWTADQDFSTGDLVLPSLGDPGEPCDPASAARIGAPYLGLSQLAAIHASSRE